MLAGISGAEPVHLEHVAQQARQRAECQRGGVSLTPSNDDIDVMYRSDRRELTDQATLANSGGTDNSDEATAISGKHALQPGQLGIAAHHHAFVAPQHHPVRLHGEQAPGRHGRVSAFDGNVFDGPELVTALDSTFAIPTGCPIAVYLPTPEPTWPAITSPEFSPTLRCKATPSRRCTSTASSLVTD